MKKIILFTLAIINYYSITTINTVFWQKEFIYIEDAIQSSNLLQTERLLTMLNELTPEQKSAYINLAQDMTKLRLAHLPPVSRSWFTTLGVLGFMGCIIPKIVLPDIPLFSTLLNLGLLGNFCLLLWGRSREQSCQKQKAYNQYQDAASITSLLMQVPASSTCH